MVNFVAGIGTNMEEFLYIWLGLGLLHYIIYSNQTEINWKRKIWVFLLCLIIGPPFFFYELYKSIKGRF